MRKVLAAAAMLFAAASAARAAAPASPDQDLAAFANGGLVESASSVYGGGWRPEWLVDENPATGWANVKGEHGPYTIVISLPERSEIHAIAFDSAAAESPERTAKAVDVLISDVSATDGFKPLASVTLKPAADGQRFAASGAGRWLKLVVKSNNGDADYSELTGFHAYGKALTSTPLKDVSGTYSSAAYGDFHLKQDGAQLSGCYEHDEGLVQGGLEAHLMRLTWSQSKGKSSGPAIMVQARDGKSFKGFWTEAGSGDWHPDWDLKKISDKVGSCPHWNVKVNVVADDLAASGRVRLYGINFDSDSDKLRADAKPAVDQLLDALKANASWKVTIEGHTDSTGNAAHNLDLSKRRAAAVKAALVAGGIDAARLSPQGYGQTKPVASNDSEIGRAQNRRVEVAKP
jgi:outer membrane protein OmpA-like peptidoglycan-associated protein